MVNKDDLYVIESEKNKIVFDAESMMIFSFPKHLDKNSIYNKIKDKYNTIKEKDKLQTSGIVKMHEIKHKIESVNLTLNVSQTCNLSCTYCLVESDYNNPMMMKDSVVEDTLKYFLKKFPNINSITFYGGEPLLNFGLIKKTIELCKKTGLKDVKYNIVSNGTICNQELIELIKDNDIAISVSIDGPQEIHDKHRVFKDGSGSFKKVVKTIERLMQNGVNPYLIAVYTIEHKRMGMSTVALYDYLCENFEKLPVNIVPEQRAFSLGEQVRCIKPLMEYYITSFLKERSRFRLKGIDQDISTLGRRKKLVHVCPGGIDNFFIDAEGNIYPCQGFGLYKDFILGKVSNNKPLLEDIPNEFLNLKNNEKCRRCWIRNLCNFCPAACYDKTGKLVPDEEYCNANREYFERMIMLLGDIFSDEDKMRIFAKNYLNKGEK